MKLLQNEAGVSFVEALAAAGVFSIGVLGLSMSLVQMGKARSKVGIVNSAISLEGLIIEGISNSSNYPDTVAARTKLLAKDKSAMSVTIEYVDAAGIPRKKPAGAAVFTPGVPLYFTRDLGPCGGSFTGGSFANDNCVIKAQMDFVADGDPAASPPIPVTWHAAYQITINPSTAIAVGNFGAPNLPFVADDYRYPTPDLSNKNRNQQGCDPATEVAVMGVNRDTGAVTCLKKPDPTESCPPGKIPTSFVVLAGKMVLDCAAVVGGGINTRTWSCDPDYALNTMPDVLSFDSREPAGTTPQCVFIAQSHQNVVPSTNNVPTINARVCPRPPSGVSYFHHNPCTQVDSKVNGKCCTIAGCSASLITFAPTAAPTSSFSYPTTDSVACSITNPANPQWSPSCVDTNPGSCAGAVGATWTAVVSLGATVSCDLNVPLTKPAH